MKMNHRLKKLLHLIVVECKISRQKLIELWDQTDKINIKFKYSLFVKENYKEYKENNENLSKKEIMEILKNQWKLMNENDKIKYMIIEDKKPRKKSLYNIFFKNEYKNIKNLNPEYNIGDISKIISNKWKDTSENDRKKLINDNEIIMNNDNEIITNNDDQKYEKIKNTLENIEKENLSVIDNFNSNYLTEDERKNIEELCHNLSEKPIIQLKKLYENNYDEKLPNTINKNNILEKIFNHERKELIKNNLSDKIKLIPKDKLIFNKNEKEIFNKKIDMLKKEEFWSLFMKYRNAYPNEPEPKENEISKEDLLEKVINHEKNKILEIKALKILEIEN